MRAKLLSVLALTLAVLLPLTVHAQVAVRFPSSGGGGSLGPHDNVTTTGTGTFGAGVFNVDFRALQLPAVTDLTATCADGQGASNVTVTTYWGIRAQDANGNLSAASNVATATGCHSDGAVDLTWTSYNLKGAYDVVFQMGTASDALGSVGYGPSAVVGTQRVFLTAATEPGAFNVETDFSAETLPAGGDAYGMGFSSGGTVFNIPNLLSQTVTATNGTFGSLLLGDPSGVTVTHGVGADSPTDACSKGSTYSRTGGGSNTTFYTCTATNTWSPVLDTVSAATHHLLSATHSDTTLGSPTHGAMIAGDSSGNWAVIPAPTSYNKFLRWNGTGSGFSWETPGDGTVTSVGLSMPSQYSVTNSPVTGSSSIAVGWNAVSPNSVFAGPAMGGATQPTFRALVAADLPGVSFTEYVYRKAAYCWGNGACGQTPEWDWNGLDSGMPTFSAGVNGTDHRASADFNDAQARDMQTSFVLPPTWNSSVAVTLDFYWVSGVADVSKSAVWQAQTVCSSHGGALTTAFNGFNTVTSAADSAANRLRVATVTSLTMTGCSAGDTLTINIKRDPAHAADNLGATAQLLAIRLGYQR